AWYKSLGYGPAFYGPLATTIVLASAAGNVGAGSLADRYGRRAVIVGTLVLSIPVLLLFAQFPGPSAFVTGALVGLLAASTGPLNSGIPSISTRAHRGGSLLTRQQRRSIMGSI